MMIARLSLLQCTPRLASTAPFLCLIVAQWEWPDMASPSQSRAPLVQIGARTKMWLGFQKSKFLLNLGQSVVGPAPRRLIQAHRFSPGLSRLCRHFGAEIDVSQMVPNFRRVGTVLQRHGALQLGPRLRQLSFAE